MIVFYILVEFRLSYALWMLQQFEKEINGKPMKLYLMYDIACVLDTHLQVRAVHVLNKLGPISCLLVQ